MPQNVLNSLRAEALNAPPSGIVEVMNYGRGRPGLIPLWAGEGELPTPRFICDAATRSLVAGETYYTANLGIADLRESLARYHERLYRRPFSADRFFVTQSGMQAIQIAVTMLAGPGDEVLVPTPAWPNMAAAVGVRGARPVSLPMTLGNGGWSLDLDRLADAVTPATKAIAINSPSNPTGWTASRDDLIAILGIARAKGLWIIADEVYGRFVYDGATLAPSFHDIALPEDRIIYVNTFSKNWAMTGWRVGWIEADPSLASTIENLIQYAVSGVATFLQRAAAVALDQGDDFIDFQVGRAAKARDLLCETLAATGRVRFAKPPGAFYLFFAVDGEPETEKLGLRLVDEANVGLAPGTAFGAAGQGYLRLCFARGPDSVAEAAGRIVKWLTH